jgi:hypothetical protein
MAAIAVGTLQPVSPVIELSAPAGAIDASSVASTGDTASTTSLTKSPGDMDVTLLRPTAAPPATLLLSPRPDALEAAAAPSASPAAPSTEAAPPASDPGAETSVPPAQAVVPPETPPIAAVASLPPDPPAADPKPAPAIKNDARYPNVTVLPPPSPANSSVVFLTLN